MTRERQRDSLTGVYNAFTTQDVPPTSCPSFRGFFRQVSRGPYCVVLTPVALRGLHKCGEGGWENCGNADPLSTCEPEGGLRHCLVAGAQESGAPVAGEASLSATDVLPWPRCGLSEETGDHDMCAVAFS